MIVRVESAEGRPWVVEVTTDDGQLHSFVRADDCTQRALRAGRQGREVGFEAGVASVTNPTASDES